MSITGYADAEQRKRLCFNPEVGELTFLIDTLKEEIFNGLEWIEYDRPLQVSP